jgi:hypothetical protein
VSFFTVYDATELWDDDFEGGWSLDDYDEDDGY